MSGEISVTPGYRFGDGEVVTNAKLNKISTEMIAKLDAGAVTAAELADGSISADKLVAEISAQLGSVADGAVTTAKLADGAVTTPKIADASVTAAKLAADAVLTNQVKYAQASNGGLVVCSGIKIIPNCQIALSVEVDDIIEINGAITVEGANCLVNLIQQNSPVLATPLLNIPTELWDRGSPHNKVIAPIYGMYRITSAGTFLASILTTARQAGAGWNVYTRYLLAKKIGNGLA